MYTIYLVATYDTSTCFEVTTSTHSMHNKIRKLSLATSAFKSVLNAFQKSVANRNFIMQYMVRIGYVFIANISLC